MSLEFTGERIVPGAANCEPTFAQKMYQEHIARYAFAAQFVNEADVLDVGCGVGYGSKWLGKAGARSVVGIDLSADAIEHARHNYFHPVVSYAVKNATEIVRGEGYDVVTCFELIEHIEEQAQVLDLIKGALRENGMLIISTPRPLDDIRTHFHVHELSFDEILSLIKRHFKYVEPFFEVNCFTSFVGRAAPNQLNQIVPVTENVCMDKADYFIFVASDQPLSGKSIPESVLTLNDDSYVLTLEKDVDILRRAEDDHKARIVDLEVEKLALARAHGEAVDSGTVLARVMDETGVIRSSLDELRQQLSQFDEIERLRVRIGQLEIERADHDRDGLSSNLAAKAGECEALLRENEDIRSDRKQMQEELADLRLLLFETQSRLATAESNAHAALAVKGMEFEAQRREMDQLRNAATLQEAELNAVRHAIAASSARLAEVETEAHRSRSAAEALLQIQERESSLKSEVNALRYRLDHAESTLARFRGSLSWALTRPVRWIGRTFKTITGGSQVK